MLNRLARTTHDANRTWWLDPATGELIVPNIPEKLMLIVSELAEGMEGYRKGLKDDHLPHYDMLSVELADALIRIFDLCGYLGINIGEIFEAKMAYNTLRVDHTAEARLAPGGKKF